MKKNIIWISLSSLRVLSMIFTACTPDTTPTSTPSPTAATATPTAAPTAAADWWDEFGEPGYGGTITVRAQQLETFSLDPGNMLGGPWQQWFERLCFMDWTLDRDTFAYKTGFTPEKYYTGILAESWEKPDAQTVIVHLREGVNWQDKPPVNGREFVAADVQFHFDYLLGTGSGFTEPNPFFAGMLSSLERAVAIDDYTVEFTFKKPTALGIDQVLSSPAIAAPESVALYEENDWHNAIGTGPWMLTDFVQVTSITFDRNPDYWGYDERYPNNQLPYADVLKYVQIKDMSTAIAAMRTGKIDMIVDQMGGLSWEQAQTLAETTPDIHLALWPMDGMCVEMRVDREPFTDINVRKALQMSINRDDIARVHYNETVTGTPIGIISPLYEEYAFNYDEWPEELKEEYSYDPDKARELLADAGYPNGFETSCITAAHYDSALLQIAKSYFMDIGVDMEIEVFDMPVYASICNVGDHEQMVFADSSAMVGTPLNSLSRRNTAVSAQDYTHHNDPYYIELMTDISSSTDISEALRLFTEADRYALEQHWAITLTSNAVTIAWQPWIKGYSGELVQGNTEKAEVFARLWIDQVLKESMLE